MTEVTIRNKELLGILDDTIERFLEHRDLMVELSGNLGDEPIGEGKKWTEPETLQQFIDKGDEHVGFPEQGYGFQVSNGVTHRPEIFAELQKHTKEDLVHYFGASNNSLTSYYPPKGYVGWHTNWNAFGFQCVLTWSESGDGYFRWYDKKNDKFVTEEDVPGWQARYYRFGEYHEPEHHLWHAAWTECPRFTLAFKWIYPMIHEDVDIPIANSKRVEQARQAQQMFIEELESEV